MDYRGNYGVILVNPSWNSAVDITEGDRIGQITLQKIEYCEWEEVEDLDKTERGEGGFGHTGIQ